MCQNQKEIDQDVDEKSCDMTEIENSDSYYEGLEQDSINEDLDEN